MARPLVLHFPFTYFPDPVGGTEVYVAGLAEQLRAQGVDSAVAAPGEIRSAYRWQGVEVRRYPVSVASNALVLAEGGCLEAIAHVLEICDELKPTLIHFHAHTRGVSVDLAKALKARGLPLVVTYHTPTLSCRRGDLLRFGRDVCSGAIAREPCLACGLHQRNVPMPFWVAGAEPIWRRLLPLSSGRLHTLLSYGLATQHYQTGFKNLFALADRAVAVCQWVYDLLQANGIPTKKLRLNRQGVSEIPEVLPLDDRASGPLRLIYLGRAHVTKGLALLLDAVAGVPHASLQLVLHVIAQDAGEVHFLEQARLRFAGDSRVRFAEPLSRAEVPTALASADAVVVPSLWLETGPLVVYEAFAAGTPIIGTRRGGIAELVSDGIDGVLVDPDLESWRNALTCLAEVPAELRAMRKHIKVPRSAREVAKDTASLYQELLFERSTA